MSETQPVMAARERIIATVEHREPDHLAVDLGSTPSSGISAVAHANLVSYLGLADQRTRVYDVVQQLAQPSDELLDRLDIDAVDIGRTFNAADKDWTAMTLPSGVDVEVPAWFHPVHQENGAWEAFNENGLRIASMPLGANFFDQTHFPYLDGYPDDFSGLASVMPNVLWSGLVHSPWITPVTTASGRPCASRPSRYEPRPTVRSWPWSAATSSSGVPSCVASTTS